MGQNLVRLPSSSLSEKRRSAGKCTEARPKHTGDSLSEKRRRAGKHTEARPKHTGDSLSEKRRSAGKRTEARPKHTGDSPSEKRRSAGTAVAVSQAYRRYESKGEGTVAMYNATMTEDIQTE